MKHHPPIPELPLLLADSTLGKLAKWLRLAGMDTRLDPATPDFTRLERISAMEHRVTLTRTKSVFHRMEPSRCLFIHSNHVMDQARQVIDDFHIQRQQLPVLSRCASCNHPLTQMPINDLRGAVPDFILQQNERFMSCPQCQRIYWPGTHATRIKSIIDDWFRWP